MNFKLVEGAYADTDSIFPDFVKDYVFSSRMSNHEIRVKYNLTHKEFKELADTAKSEYGLSRRGRAADEGKYFYRKGNGFIIRKTIDGVQVYFGYVHSLEVARKVVELCKKECWNIDACKDIIHNWREYVV